MIGTSDGKQYESEFHYMLGMEVNRESKADLGATPTDVRQTPNQIVNQDFQALANEGINTIEPFHQQGPTMSDEQPDSIKPGQQFAGNAVPGSQEGIMIDSDNLNFDPNRDKRHDKYNFSSDLGADLSPENLRYHKWIQKQSKNMGRDLYEDTEDYDMQGYFKHTRPHVTDNPEDVVDETGVILKKGQHFTDRFKKPNHPTFSDESVYHNEMDTYGTGRNAKGGRWEKDGEKWTFTPGESNLKYHGTQGLIDYFKRHEPDAKLILPGQ